MSNKKILMIGASGSLGEGICNEIYSQYEITGTYLNSQKSLKNISFLKLDITNQADFSSLEVDFDCVILIAGAMPATMKGYDPKKYIDVNVNGTLNVLEYCRKNKIKKLIYIMTFSDRYDHFYSGVPIKANGPASLNYTGDHSIYSISKVAACELLEHYHQEYNLQTIIFRIPTVYCYDDKFDYYVNGEIKTKAYIRMIKNVMTKNEIEVWGDINNAKDMPYIKDFARLISLAIEHDSAQGIFNAGTGNPISLDNLVDTIIEVFSTKNNCRKIFLEEKPSQPNFTFDMTETKKVFGYEPKYNLRNMLIDIKKNLKFIK
ncbi:NAD(P)-dependent oxidoreductase [Utexia brackfieldae]|uniref:NAD-dependent epimerase/dehydratase family protein n=1 Tax=Utexia brackfieldae TaxID=3074108 RepID=UPI00370D2EB3